MNIYPLRVFLSCTEWLAPNEVWQVSNPRIIRSGFMALENDDSLAKSLETAQYLSQVVNGADYIFSGNKSIHVWVPIKVDDLKDKQIAFAKLREKAERKYRYKLFDKIKHNAPYELDNRISADPRRVVPIPHTLNAFTMRKVIPLQEEELFKLDVNQIKTKSQIEDFM